MAWKSWSDDEILYSADLNGNFQYLTDLIDGGITAGMFGADCINDVTFIADNVIDDTHVDFSGDNGVPAAVLQRGRDTATYVEQWIFHGTAGCAATNTNYTDITITFSDAEMADSGEPSFEGSPFFDANVAHTATTTDDIYHCVIKSISTNQAVVTIIHDTDTIADTLTINWMVIGESS